jgi:hypothetical protein
MSFLVWNGAIVLMSHASCCQILKLTAFGANIFGAPEKLLAPNSVWYILWWHIQ